MPARRIGPSASALGQHHAGTFHRAAATRDSPWRDTGHADDPRRPLRGARDLRGVEQSPLAARRLDRFSRQPRLARASTATGTNAPLPSRQKGDHHGTIEEKQDDILALETQERKHSAVEEIRRKKQAALDKLADQGRAPLLAALEKVKIGAMDRAQAKRLADGIAALGIEACWHALTRHRPDAHPPKCLR
jgi:hypothetical protein